MLLGAQQGGEEAAAACSMEALTNRAAVLDRGLQEIGKVLDGFTVADTLVIKAQVQVIL